MRKAEKGGGNGEGKKERRGTQGNAYSKRDPSTAGWFGKEEDTMPHASADNAASLKEDVMCVTGGLG
eukprot:1199865-Pyramimonas_sp.AAC.1